MGGCQAQTALLPTPIINPPRFLKKPLIDGAQDSTEAASSFVQCPMKTSVSTAPCNLALGGKCVRLLCDGDSARRLLLRQHACCRHHSPSIELRLIGYHVIFWQPARYEGGGDDNQPRNSLALQRLLEGLTPNQAAAVHGEGAPLIVAGAGTGRTLAITQRITSRVAEKGSREDPQRWWSVPSPSS